MTFLKALNNPNTYSDKINEELDRELIQKSVAAAPGFFMCAAWIVYNHLETIQFSNWIQLLGLFLMVLSVTRYLISYLFEISYFDLKNASLAVKINIIINGTLWSIALCATIIESNFENMTSAIQVIALILGLTLSSPVTISYNLRIALSYQWIMTIPAICILFFLSATQKNNAALNGGSIIAIGIVYLLIQTLEANRQIKKRLKQSLDLQIANLNLQESKDLLIKESAKLQHSTRLATIGKVSGEFAHEINNPLSITQGNIELSLASLERNSQDIEPVKAKLKKSLLSISRITKIISGLRHFSKQSAHEQNRLIFISDILDETIGFCSEKFKYNKVRILVSPHAKYQIRANSIEISQVFLNLFTNSIDALSHTPVDQRQITISVVSDKNILKISISNSGEKITPEVAAHLFEAFFTTKDVGSGMGLGLSISKKIIESHRGTLKYDPLMPDTTFVIELPLHTSTVQLN